MPDGQLCHCVLCHDYGDRGNANCMDLDISESIRRFGWHVVMVPEDDTGPGFAYTIGLTHSFGTPELAMFGLDIRILHQVLNMLGQKAASGTTPMDGQGHAGVLGQRLVVLRLADLRWHRTFFAQAIGFYRRPPLPVLQVCWPDSTGAFHWQEDSADQHRQSQPRLWVPPSEHPHGVWTAEL